MAGQCWWNNTDMSVRFSIDYGTPASIAKSSSPTAQEQLDLDRLAFKGFADYAEVRGWTKSMSIPGAQGADASAG